MNFGHGGVLTGTSVGQRQVIRVLVSWFGLGFSPWAPGTVGTIGAMPLVWLLAMRGPFSYMGLTLLFTLVAIGLCHLYEREENEHDSSHVVIDEVAGFLVAMAWLPMTWQTFVLAFILFRFFDVVKPGPIRMLDRRIQGGLGVVADDLAAGIATNVILQVIYTETNWLGAQVGWL